MGIVAPHAGAWIETDYRHVLSGWGLSHLTRVRGLKPHVHMDSSINYHVAPHAGAWIETDDSWEEFKSEPGRTSRGCVD